MFAGILIALPLKPTLCLSACLPSFVRAAFNYAVRTVALLMSRLPDDLHLKNMGK